MSSRYFSNNIMTKLPNITTITNNSSCNTDKDKTTDKMQLSTVQIEQYKRRLYDLIQEGREPEKVGQLNRFLIEECEPSLHLFNIILKGQLMTRNVDGIKETLLLIAKNKFAFNSVTLNLLLVYYRDLDMMEEAGKLFRAMESHGKDGNNLINCAGPNLSAYTTMISGWSRRGDFAKAKEYFDGIGTVEGLKADDHANCAMLNAAVSTGNLEYAKTLYKSILNPNFVARKLWLRASFRLGGYEEAFEQLIKEEKDKFSLETSEMIKWLLNDIKSDWKMLAKVSLYVLGKALERDFRIGDPQCLHSLLDALKRDPEAFNSVNKFTLKWPKNILPVIGGRLLHQLVTTKSAGMAKKIFGECGRLGIKLPAGLINDYNNLIENK